MYDVVVSLGLCPYVGVWVGGFVVDISQKVSSTDMVPLYSSTNYFRIQWFLDFQGALLWSCVVIGAYAKTNNQWETTPLVCVGVVVCVCVSIWVCLYDLCVRVSVSVCILGMSSTSQCLCTRIYHVMILYVM